MLDILTQLPGRLFALLIFSFFNYHIEKVCNFILLDINVVQCLEVSMFLLLCVLSPRNAQTSTWPWLVFHLVAGVGVVLLYWIWGWGVG